MDGAKTRPVLPKPKDLKFSRVSTCQSPKSSCNAVYSPVTDLAVGLGELSTGYGNTPKRRLSLATDGTPTPTIKPVVLEKQLSADAGYDEAARSYEDSPFLSSRFGDLLNTPLSAEKNLSAKTMYQSTALRRFQSMPIPFYGLEDTATPEICHTKSRLSFSDELDGQSPCFKSTACSKPTDEDETSQDSGVSVEGSDFRFAEPTGRPPARRILRALSDDICSSPSTPFSLFRRKPSEDFSPVTSPVKLHCSPLTSADDDNDDGFLELIDMEDGSSSVPSNISGLLTAPMCKQSSEDQENKSRISLKRGLFRSPSTSVIPDKAKSFCARPRSVSFKRSEPADCDTTPIQSKRRRSVAEKENTVLKETTNTTASNTPRTLHRCFSETEAMIKRALTRREQEPDLIGDLSRPYTLPLCKSKHQDLKGINPDTMTDLLNGHYDHLIKEAIIIDARYPYEYQGGHIRGSQNLYTKESIVEKFLAPGQASKYTSAPGEKPTIIIFHCEFSSERAPRLCRFLRNKDRDANTDNYPFLNFPELYILEGGYKDFFNSHIECCEPATYLPMLHEDHGEDLRKYRSKTKQYSGDAKAGRKGRVPFRPGLKL